MNKKLRSWATGISCGLFSQFALAVNVPISLFPIEHYNQSVDHWIQPNNPDYDHPLLSSDYQQQRLQELYNHLYATDTPNSSSPWSAHYVNSILQQQPTLQSAETDIINWFDNSNKDTKHIGYGENFRPHTTTWIQQIRNNINLDQLDNLQYDPSRRAIAITNIEARVLPTHDPHYYHFTLAGQGYPFDNLQMSSLWVGTPLYVLTQTQDHAWSYVLTPSFIAWVPSNDIANAPKAFIKTWSQAAKQHMSAIIQPKTSVSDENKQFQFYAYPGTILPLAKQSNDSSTLLIPTRGKNGLAEIHQATLSKQQAVTMPLSATRHNFARMMKQLINRPYAWGGLGFYNDCSQELKSLYATFGIWLPRHSSSQVTVSKMDDESELNAKQRIQYLLQHGHPMMSIIYIGGHVVLYTGAVNNPQADNQPMAMTYQNLWGLSPADRSQRVVIGESVLLPLLEKYPEDTNLSSLADKKYFKIAYLDQWPTVIALAHSVNVRQLAYPEVMLNQ